MLLVLMRGTGLILKPGLAFRQRGSSGNDANTVIRIEALYKPFDLKLHGEEGGETHRKRPQQ